ncbi:MAG: outer rane fibronectin-binding protein, partial [Actinomycetota bacterium]
VVLKKSIFKMVVNFKFDSRIISKNDKKKLKNFFAKLYSAGYRNFRVQGHTDSYGSKKYNVKLSKKRASSVKQVSKLLNDISTNLKWFGENKPVKSNKKPKGRAENRRVEISVIWPNVNQ